MIRHSHGSTGLRMSGPPTMRRRPVQHPVDRPPCHLPVVVFLSKTPEGLCESMSPGLLLSQPTHHVSQRFMMGRRGKRPASWRCPNSRLSSSHDQQGARRVLRDHRQPDCVRQRSATRTHQMLRCRLFLQEHLGGALITLLPLRRA